MKFTVTVIALIMFLFFFIRFLEKKSLYFPLRNIEGTPRDLKLDYDELMISTEDGIRISAWYISAPSARATVLLSHGNGGNISHRLDKIRILHALAVNVLIFDYRGYGVSEGSPTEKGLYLDGEAAYSYLVNERKIPARDIIGYGESLGGAVIIDLAGRHELGGIVIEGSFTSIRDMGKHYFPFIPSFVYKTGFDSYEKIHRVQIPRLHFHSPDDEIVPFRLGKKLFENSPGPGEFVELRGGHNDAFLVSEGLFMSKLDSFIAQR